jgi:hypothetical protein
MSTIEVMEEMSHRPAGAGQIFYEAPSPEEIVKKRARIIIENKKQGNVKATAYCQIMCAVRNTFCWGNDKLTSCPFYVNEVGCAIQPLQYCK